MYRVKGADQKEYGPVAADQVRQWIQEGRLNRASLVQKEGEAAWKPLEQFPEFDGLGAPAAIPPAVSAMGAPAEPGAAVAEARVPAILMIVTAGLSVLYGIFSLVQIALLPVEEILKQVEKQTGQGFPMQIPTIAFKILVMVVGSFPLALGLLALVGGIRFLSLRNRGLALAGAIVLMIPCCGTAGPLCFLGLPVGIWATIVLNRPGIRSAFK